MKKEEGILYRYEDSYTEYGINDSLDLRKYVIVKETPCGHWVYPQYYHYGKNKWVSKTSGKRLCHPTKEEALKSYIYRKKYQIRMSKWKVECAKSFIKIAEEMEKGND